MKKGTKKVKDQVEVKEETVKAEKAEETKTSKKPSKAKTVKPKETADKEKKTTPAKPQPLQRTKKPGVAGKPVPQEQDAIQRIKIDEKKVTEIAMEKGCLLSLHMSGWGNRAALDEEELGDLPREVVRGTKRLINTDNDEYKALREIRRKIKRKAMSLVSPWPIRGVYFISKERIGDVSAVLDSMIDEHDKRVDAFVQVYGAEKEQMKKQLKGTKVKFDESKYPSPESIRMRFNIRYRFFKFAIPDDMLSKAQVDQEWKKLRAEISEAAELGIMTIRKNFTKLVVNLRKRLEGDKSFNKTRVTRLKDFLDDFENVNIWDDGELAKLVAQCKTYLGDVDPKDLKENDKFATKVSKEMDKTITGLKKLDGGSMERYVDF